MKRFFNKIPGKNHVFSEKILVALMAIIIIIAAVVIKASTFFVTKLNPVVIVAKIRGNSDTTDIDSNSKIM